LQLTIIFLEHLFFDFYTYIILKRMLNLFKIFYNDEIRSNEKIDVTVYYFLRGKGYRIEM